MATKAQSAFETLPQARLVDFQTEEGIFGFRYDSLLYYRWETHSRDLGPQALHFFFSSATVSVVGHELTGILPFLRRRVISEFRLGRRGKVAITYIAVRPQDTKKKYEAVNRGIAITS